jgi:hypothetical protein
VSIPSRAQAPFASASSPTSGVLLPAWEEPSSAGLVGETLPVENAMDPEGVPEVDDGTTPLTNQNIEPHSTAEEGSGSDDDGGEISSEDSAV